MLIALAIVLLLFITFVVAQLLGCEEHRVIIQNAITSMLNEI